MSGSGIRYPCYNVRLDIIPFGKVGTTIVAHFFYADSLVGTGWIAIINPKKRTYFHVFSRCHQGFNTLWCYDVDFSGTQFFIILITQILIGKGFKREAIGILFFSNDKWCASVFVSCCINSLWCKEHQCQRTVNQFQCIMNPFDDIFFLIDNGGYQFGRVDVSTTHFEKMRVSIGK